MPWKPQKHRMSLKKPRRIAQTRLKTKDRGYGGTWRKLRRMWLQAHPLCAWCNGLAAQVDHIKPLADGGTNDEKNLQSLCASCHAKKTRQDNR